jgi:signal transduction histidine kinase
MIGDTPLGTPSVRPPDSSGRYALGPVPPNCDAHELARRISHLQMLHRVSMALTSSMRPDEMGHMLLHEFLSISEGRSAIFWYVDFDTRQLIPSMRMGATKYASGPMSLDDGDDLAVQTVLQIRSSLDRNGMQSELEVHGLRIQPDRICIPLVTQEEILGVIDIQTRRIARIPPDIEEILLTLAAQAAMLIRAAIQRQQLEQSYTELAVLHEIQQEISSTVDYPKVLTIVVERLKALLNAAEVTVRLVEELNDQRVLRIAETTGRIFHGQTVVPLNEAHLDHEVLSGGLLYMADVRTDQYFTEKEEAIRSGVVSMITAPLMARSRVIGTIRIYTTERREFDFAERKMLLAVAGMAATAIEHARLYRQIDGKNRELNSSYQRLRDAQKELIKKDRLALLGEMAATVAHEVRNPLTSVRGFAQRILRRATDLQDQRIMDYTAIIMEEVDRLNRIMKDVLDYGREVRPRISLGNLNDTITEVLSLVGDELSQNQIALLLDLDPNLPPIPHDASMIRNVLLNLTQNAIHAMAGGGALMVKTQDRGTVVRLRLADTGLGMTAEMLRRIWTPFYTTKIHGSGLGLPVVQKVIDAHYGKIIVRSKPGRGTIFDIQLPKQSPEVSESELTRSPE